jgi:hypothetical protein
MIGVPGLNSVVNHFFYYGRQTIGVPGLNSVMNNI